MDPVGRLALDAFYSRGNAPETNDVGYAYFLIYNRRLVHRLALKALSELRPTASSPLRVLDVGCGTAEHLDHLLRWEREALGPQPVIRGFDADETSLALARARFAELGVDAELARVDASARFPFTDSSFDLVFCTDVLRYLTKPDDVVREIARVTAPGGFLVLTAANEPTVQGSLKRLARRLLRAHRPTDAELHRRGITEPRGETVIDGNRLPLYGAISARTTVGWEQLARDQGFRLVSYGTYELVRRHTTDASQFAIALFFGANFLVSLLPSRLGRHFGAMTALLLRRG